MDAIAAAAWTPDQLTNVLQRMDSFAYASAPIGGLPVVESSVGTAAVPRGQRCVLFDGVDDLASSTNAAFRINGEVAISAWIRPTTNTGNQAIACCTNGTSVYFIFAYNGGRLQIWQTGGGQTLQSAVLTLAGSFNHVAMTRSGSAGNWTLTIYLNGVAIATTTTATNSNGSTADGFAIGAAGSAGIWFFNGSIYDARIYSVAKSASEIQAIFNQASTPTTIDRTGLLAAWWLNEESGTVHYDWSGNGRNLTATNVTQSTYHTTDAGVRYNAANELGYTLSGSVVIPRNEAVPTQDAAGGSLQFAGPIKLNATMEVPCLSLSGSDYAAASVFSLGTTHTLSVVAKWSSGILIGSDGIDYGLYSDGSNLYYGPNVGGSVFATVAHAVDSVNFHHYAVVRNGTQVKFFVDGVQVGTTQTLSSNPSLSFRDVGSRNGASLFVAGQIGNIYVHSTAKSDSEVLAIARGLDDRSGLLAHWPIQEGPGATNSNRTLYDTSGNGRNLTVISGTVATQWANRTNVVRDWCIEYGGSIAANGAFVPGRVGSNLDAAGNTKGIAAGTHGNPYSRFVPNFWSAPSLVNIGSTASDLYAPSGMAGVTSELTADTRYANTRRYLAVRSALTGSDKTNAQGWVA